MVATQSAPNRDTYWFADEESKTVVERFIAYDDPNTMWATNPMLPVWYRVFYAYYSTVIKPQGWESALVFKGKEGELIEVLIPLAKSLMQQLVDIATKQKLAWMALADSTAVNVTETARLGTGLAKQVTREQKVDLKWAQSLENEMLTGLGFLYVKWRTDKGPFWAMQPTELMGEDGNPMQIPTYKGDVEITVPTVHDVLFDPNIPDPEQWEWVRVREVHNRWNLIAQFPQMAEEIRHLPSVRTALSGAYSTTGSFSPTDDDYVYVYAVYHIATPALRKGRIVVYGDINTVFFDGDNFYGELPLYCSRGKAIPLSGYGDPFFIQLLAAQEMFDVMVSSVCTNNAAHAVQNVLHPRGAGISVEQILGMNFIAYTAENVPGGGKPEALQLTQSAPETYKLIEILEKFMMDLSRVNSALRGTPPSGVTSGAAIATLTATAVESVEAIVKASRINLRKAMMGAINCYRRFASVKREVEISGIGEQKTSRTFTGRDLDPIRTIELQEVNPLMQTQAGRIEIAKDLMAQGLVANTKAYFDILNGSPVEEMYKDEMSEEDLVKRENEAIMNGEQVVMLNTDDHPFHIRCHAKALNDPKARREQKITQPMLAHILEHLQASKMMDPALAAMIATGKMPDPALMAPPMMQGMLPGGAPPAGAPPPEGGGQPPPEGGKPQPQQGTQATPGPEQGEAKPAKPAEDLLRRA